MYASPVIYGGGDYPTLNSFGDEEGVMDVTDYVISKLKKINERIESRTYIKEVIEVKVTMTLSGRTITEDSEGIRFSINTNTLNLKNEVLHLYNGRWPAEGN